MNFSKMHLKQHGISGHWRGRSLLMEDGVLSWLVANLNTASTSTRRHLELALCHLAQNGKDFRFFFVFIFMISSERLRKAQQYTSNYYMIIDTRILNQTQIKIVSTELICFADDNARDFITGGGLKELIEISDRSVREDIRSLAKKTLQSSPVFRGKLPSE